LRSERELHPLLVRIMQIHVAEEARHISFAHEYLRRRTPELGLVRKTLLTALFPVVMRVLCDVIITPPKEITTELGVPKEVIAELYWDSPSSRELLRETFGDVRMLAEEIGVLNRVT